MSTRPRAVAVRTARPDLRGGPRRASRRGAASASAWAWAASARCSARWATRSERPRRAGGGHERQGQRHRARGLRAPGRRVPRGRDAQAAPRDLPRADRGGRAADRRGRLRAARGEAILPLADRVARRLGPPTEFELLTAVMFRHFADGGPRRRAGRGGPRRAARRDQRLGRRRGGAHQRGPRPHGPPRADDRARSPARRPRSSSAATVAVTGADGEALAILRRRCARLGVPARGGPAGARSWAGRATRSRWTCRASGATESGSAAATRRANAAVADALLDALERGGDRRRCPATRAGAGYAAARWPGRLELLRRAGPAAGRARCCSTGRTTPTGRAALAAALDDLRPRSPAAASTPPAPAGARLGGHGRQGRGGDDRGRGAPRGRSPAPRSSAPRRPCRARCRPRPWPPRGGAPACPALDVRTAPDPEAALDLALAPGRRPGGRGGLAVPRRGSPGPARGRPARSATRRRHERGPPGRRTTATCPRSGAWSRPAPSSGAARRRPPSRCRRTPTPACPAPRAALAIGPRTFAWGQRTLRHGDPQRDAGLVLGRRPAGGRRPDRGGASPRRARMVADGADLLDVGGASSPARPRAADAGRGDRARRPGDPRDRRGAARHARSPSTPPARPSRRQPSTPAPTCSTTSGAWPTTRRWSALAAERGVPIVLMHNRGEAALPQPAAGGDRRPVARASSGPWTPACRGTA